MLRLYSGKRTARILARYAGWIAELSRRFGLPEAWIKAVLRREIEEIDLLDLAADALVRLYWLRWRLRRLLCRLHLCRRAEPRPRRGPLGKRDSSTGYAQIFAAVAIDAANYALERGLEDAAGLGLPEGRRPDRERSEDLCAMWRRLARDPRFNIRMGALNMLAAAEEMNGHTDIARYGPEELQRAFTRYNAKVDRITDYGRRVYAYYLDYSQAPDGAAGTV